MGIATGYVCLCFMLVLLVKYPARKLHWKQLDQVLMKCHKYAALAFLLVGTVHFALVSPVLKSRMAVISLSGICAAAAGLGIVIFCHTMKKRKKEIIIHRVLSALLLCMAIVHILFYSVGFRRYQTAMQQITLREIDLNTVADGSYIGDFDAGYIYARVRLRVENHQITDIEILEHRNERGAEAERILNAMISGQTIQVDAVSGATNSSLVIEKACENALEGG